jgi:hypothetical protein
MLGTDQPGSRTSTDGIEAERDTALQTAENLIFSLQRTQD